MPYNTWWNYLDIRDTRTCTECETEFSKSVMVKNRGNLCPDCQEHKDNLDGYREGIAAGEITIDEVPQPYRNELLRENK